MFYQLATQMQDTTGQIKAEKGSLKEFKKTHTHIRDKVLEAEQQTSEKPSKSRQM